jgi:hypothetical protein
LPCNNAGIAEEAFMKIVKTEVTETHVVMLIADSQERDAATSYIEVKVPISELRQPGNYPQPPELGDPNLSYLLETRRAVLLYTRAAITELNKNLIALGEARL